jgi:predicted nuclease of restriction endonuclease-like (RecB) superfamily
MDLNKLSDALKMTNHYFRAKAASAVNTALTLRNWLFGYYIVEYEQKGEDRAVYGEQLLIKLVELLQEDVKDISLTYLKNVRKFYITYPQIGQTVSDFSKNLQSSLIKEKGQTVSDFSFIESLSSISQNDEFENPENKEINVSARRIIQTLSFSHLTELIKIDDPLKRTFYEIESINGTWSVRELKRQISTLYYERSGFSRNKEKLELLVNQKSEKLKPSDLIKDPFTFEFLGLPHREMIEESDLEQALIENLQQFLLELGNGFCFESRQKRILIGDEYYYIDMVFYHRILKCHVLVDLKVDQFSHQYAGQLNSYIDYYRKNIKQKRDKKPIGILLCTGGNKTLVEYATAGLSKNLFIAEYKVNLPSEKELKDFITQKLRELT